MPSYHVYALHLHSTHPLWHVAVAPESWGTAPDIALNFSHADAPSSAWDRDSKWVVLRAQKGPGWHLSLAAAPEPSGVALRLYTRRQADETTVLFGRHAARIEVRWRSTAADAERFWMDLSGWILGSVLGYAMCLRGMPILHGSVVAVDGKAVGLLGVSGAGKSTLAAAFVAAGHAMLADDHLVVGRNVRQYFALPGPPRLRLWPASLPVLKAQPDTLPGWADLAGKQYVEPGAGAYCSDPLPLAAIYVLMPRDPGCTAVTIREQAPAAALNALMNQRFCTVPLDPAYPTTSLAALSDLTRQTPVSLLHRPQGLASLPAVVAAIQKDVAGHGR